MSTRILTTVSTIALLAGSTGAIAQHDRPSDRQPEKQTDRAQQRLHLVLSEDLIGSNLIGRTGDTAGTVNDIIVDARTGKVRYAIASIGGVMGLGDKVVAVPAGELRWDHNANAYVLGMTASRLGDMPAFDAKNWRELQRDNWEKALIEHHESMKKDMDKEGTDRTKEDTGERNADRSGYQKSLVRISDVTGTAIQARAANAKRDVTLERNREKIGQIDGAVIEVGTHRVPLIAISTGGVLGFGADDRLVPWRAMTMAEDNLILKNISAESFKNLEVVTRKDIDRFERPADIAKFYKPFGVEPDTFKDEDESRSSGG
jgi:sporulation protein YlmC with PRC-barrel domain